MTTTCNMFLDSSFKVIFATKPPEPFTAEDFAGKPLWAGFGPAAERLQAAMLRLITDHQPITIDVETENDGVRITLLPVDLRDARVLVTLRKSPAEFQSLTDRQREICGMLAAGMMSTEIAKQLERTRETVDNHRAQIAKRIGIRPQSLIAWCGENREWF